MTSDSHDRPSPSEIYRHRKLDEIATRWNAKAAHWDEDLQDPFCHLNEDHAYERFLEQLAETIRQRARFCASHGIIDVGCGTGLVLSKVISSFAWGLGIDISQAMIDAARSKSIARANFVVGDCFNLSALEKRAAAVVSRGVLLSHYGSDNALALLRSARSVLEPGGFLFWDFLNLAGQAGSSHRPESKTYYDSKTVCELAQNAGFGQAGTIGDPCARVGMLLAE